MHSMLNVYTARPHIGGTKGVNAQKKRNYSLIITAVISVRSKKNKSKQKKQLGYCSFRRKSTLNLKDRGVFVIGNKIVS